MLLRRSCLVGLLVLSLGSAALASEIPIGGRIVIAGGKPLADAEVALLALPDSLAEAGGLLEDTPAEPVARALSDKQGRFELAAPHAGLWRVRIDAPGLVPLQSDLGPLIEPLELPDAELSVDEGIALRVADREGKPIPGALVLARSDGSRFAFNGAAWAPPMRGGRTDEQGGLVLPRSAGERVTISAAAPGFVASERRGVRGTAANLRLDRGPRRSVEVVSASGQPVGDVLLFVGSRPHPVGRTDEAGRGVATVDPAAPLTLRLLAADGRRLETQLRPTALTSERPRRLSLPDRLLISGRLLDADTRRPIGGGLVWDGSDPDEASTSDGAGGFVLGGPAGHRLDVSAGAPGYLFADAFEFQLNDDGRPGPTLALRPAAAVAGTVIDGDGEPVTGAELELVVRRDPSMMRIEIGGTRSLARSRSGPSGRFRISPIDPEQSYELRVRADGYAPASEVLTGLEPYRTRAGLRIALTRGQTLTGTVVDSDGNPLRDAAVRLAAAAAGRGLGGMRLTQPGGDESRFGADSDDAGRFTVAGLPVGKFDLTVSRSGFAQRTVPAVELKQDDDATDVGEVVLEPGEKIHGIVIDRDRQPVEGAEIELQESGPMMMMALPGGAGSGETEPDAVTDPAGWFTLEDLGREERHNFTVRRTGFVEARLNRSGSRFRRRARRRCPDRNESFAQDGNGRSGNRRDDDDRRDRGRRRAVRLRGSGAGRAVAPRAGLGVSRSQAGQRRGSQG
jgi:protocatechuate 3,4-dioxygenase beta subunit